MVVAKARFALLALVAFALIAQPSPASAQLDEQLGSLADQAQQTAQEISDSFNQSGSEILNGTEEFAADLGGKLNDTAMAIANKTQQAVSKLNETIQAGAEKIGNFVSDANETIQGAIANGTEGGPPTPCCRAATAECLACSAGVTVEEFCAGEGNAVGCDDSSSDDGRRRLQQDIGQNAAEKGQEIGQNFADAGKQIADNAVSASQDFVDGLNDTLTEGGAKLNDTLREGASNLNDTLWDGASNLNDALTDGASNLNDTLRENSSNITDAAGDVISGANDTLREGASSLNDTLREGASNVVNKTKDTLSDGVQNVQDNASDRRDARKEGDDEGSSDDGRRRLQQFDGFENVVGTLAGGLQTVVNATTQVLQGVADGISGIGNNNVTDGISGAINSTTGFLSNVGDRIQSGAQNLVNTTETFVSNANDTIQGMISRNRTGRGDDNTTMPPQPCCKAMNAKCLSCTENMTEEEYCGMFPETIGCDELGEEEKEGSRRLSLRKLLESPPMEDPVPVVDDATAEEGGANVTVEIGSDPPGQMIYAPKDLTINAGDTVVWTNVDGIPHDVVFDSAPDGVDVESISHPKLFNTVGESVSTTFTVPGTYTYFCTPHKYAGMDGTINVE